MSGHGAQDWGNDYRPPLEHGQPWPGPAGGRPQTRPRKSRVGLILGLVGGFCALVLVGGAIGGYVVWQHHEASQRRSLEQATLAVYHEMGRPTGFTEQQGSPRLRGTTWLTATWTAPSGQGDPVYGPINATAAWLDEHMKNVQPNDDDVKRGYSSKGEPYFLDDPKAQNIQVTLSGTTSTDRIDVSMFL